MIPENKQKTNANINFDTTGFLGGGGFIAKQNPKHFFKLFFFDWPQSNLFTFRQT